MSDFKADSKVDFRAIGATVRHRAAGELRNRIVSGRLPPGSRLDLDQLTVEFGTSRTPIREALIELSHEGLVTVAPRSGITVLGLTAWTRLTTSPSWPPWRARRPNGPPPG